MHSFTLFFAVAALAAGTSAGGVATVLIDPRLGLAYSSLAGLGLGPGKILYAAVPAGHAPQIVAVQAAPQPPSDNPDVLAARALHLAEVDRQNNAALAALASANSRPAAPAAAPQAPAPAPQPPQDNPDVAAARSAHLAEVLRQNNAALSALAAARARELVPQDAPDVAAVKAQHLAEVARQNAAALSALAAANARAALGSAIVVGPQVPLDNPDVVLARSLHLAEVSRQNNAALAALAARGLYPAYPGYGKLIG